MASFGRLLSALAFGAVLVAVACDDFESSGEGASDAGDAAIDATGTSDASDDGFPVIQCSVDPSKQVAGDCSRFECADNGSIAAIPDDSDVPAATDCITSACAGGKPVLKPVGTGCTGGGQCNAAGKCIKAGDGCLDKVDCPSGFCVDGVCCKTACEEECMTCSKPDAKGTCVAVPYREEDPFFIANGAAVDCTVAVGGAVCNGAGKCRRRVGTACEVDATCLSGKCKVAAPRTCLGAPDEICSQSFECASNKCMSGSCAP